MGRTRKHNVYNNGNLVEDGKFIIVNNGDRAVRKSSILDIVKAKGLFGYVILLRGNKTFRVALEYGTEEERDIEFRQIIDILNK